MLIRAHADDLIVAAGHADFQVSKDDEAVRRAQLFHALFEQRIAMVRAEAGARFQHRRAIGLEGAGQRARGVRGGRVNLGPDLFTLEHHVEEVTGETALLEPGPAPDIREQRHELGKMRRPFDRPGLDAEARRFGVVVQRFVARIFLLGQQVDGAAQFALQDLVHGVSLFPDNAIAGGLRHALLRRAGSKRRAIKESVTSSAESPAASMAVPCQPWCSYTQVAAQLARPPPMNISTI